MSKTTMTLCLVCKHPKILLGMKKRGFGHGKWNGFGGKVHVGETIEEATVREVREEVGIEILQPEKRGLLTLTFDHNDDELEMHLFATSSFNGEVSESEEMKPDWFHVDNIPFNDMWADDALWVPIFLEGKCFTGSFLFNNEDEIINYSLEEVDAL